MRKNLHALPSKALHQSIKLIGKTSLSWCLSLLNSWQLWCNRGTLRVNCNGTWRWPCWSPHAAQRRAQKSEIKEKHHLQVLLKFLVINRKYLQLFSGGWAIQLTGNCIRHRDGGRPDCSAPTWSNSRDSNDVCWRRVSETFIPHVNAFTEGWKLRWSPCYRCAVQILKYWVFFFCLKCCTKKWACFCSFQRKTAVRYVDGSKVASLELLRTCCLQGSMIPAPGLDDWVGFNLLPP